MDGDDSDPLGQLRALLQVRELQLRRALADKGELVLRHLQSAHASNAALADSRHVDPLTGLLRHGYFRARLGFEVKRSLGAGQPLGLIFMDLDGFATFNEELGYERGEDALANIGRGLGTSWLVEPAARPPVFGREGGNCFGVLLPAAEAKETAFRAEDLRYFVERLPVGPPLLTASVGYAQLKSGDGATPRAFVASAFAALQRAKSEGGNRVVGAE